MTVHPLFVRFSTLLEKRSLFVGNLSEAATDKTLRSLFSGFGTILSARVQKRVNGESKGWG